MIKKIIRDYRFIIVRFGRNGQDLYFPYSDKGFGELFFNEEQLRKKRGDIFYFKFEGLSKNLAERVKKLIKSADYTGIFCTDKRSLETAIQQNL